MANPYSEETQTPGDNCDAGDIVMTLATRLMDIDKHARNTFKDDLVARDVYRRNESYKAILECSNAPAVFDAIIVLGSLRSALAITGRIVTVKHDPITDEFDAGYVVHEKGSVCLNKHRDLVTALIAVIYQMSMQHIAQPKPSDTESMVHYLLSTVNDADVVAVEKAVQPAIAMMERQVQPNPVRTLLEMLKTTRVKHKECVQLLTKWANDDKAEPS